MVVDKNYCMSSFLTLRYVADENKIFGEGISRVKYTLPDIKYQIKSAADIDVALKELLENVDAQNTGIMLSGGMDSAILASYMPKGMKAYTLESQAEGAKSETKEARYFAERCGLEHHVVKITWDDYLNYAPLCMKQKGAPVHSIEPMIYKACIQAKNDGCTKLIFGETADIKFGGLSGLLSRDWTTEEFAERYSYVNPQKILKNPVKIYSEYDKYSKNNICDAHAFINGFLYLEAMNSYSNSCTVAGVEFVAPYSKMMMSIPVDLQRVRKGENKYLIRELFAQRYPDSIPAVKLPMPRAVEIWLKNWQGPTRKEFLPNCTEGLTGDQRWYVYVLEWFLNLMNIE